MILQPPVIEDLCGQVSHPKFWWKDHVNAGLDMISYILESVKATGIYIEWILMYIDVLNWRTLLSMSVGVSPCGELQK